MHNHELYRTTRGDYINKNVRTPMIYVTLKSLARAVSATGLDFEKIAGRLGRPTEK
jgi:hypothetical protein